MKRSMVTLGILSIALAHSVPGQLFGMTTPATQSSKRPALSLLNLLSAQEQKSAQALQEAAKKAQQQQKTPASPTRVTSASPLQAVQLVKEQKQHNLNSSLLAKQKFFTSKRFVLGALAVTTLVGLLFGQVKYKMISRMFKAAPKNTKVSWLTYLTGITLR